MADVTYPPELLPYPDEGEIGEVIVMSDMDWAEQAASAIYNIVSDNFAEETPAKIRSRIAFDLRKARADGMREAAAYFHDQGCDTIDESTKRYLDAEFIRTAATKLDPPSTAAKDNA